MGPGMPQQDIVKYMAGGVFSPESSTHLGAAGPTQNHNHRPHKLPLAPKDTIWPGAETNWFHGDININS